MEKRGASCESENRPVVEACDTYGSKRTRQSRQREAKRAGKRKSFAESFMICLHSVDEYYKEACNSPQPPNSCLFKRLCQLYLKECPKSGDTFSCKATLNSGKNGSSKQQRDVTIQRVPPLESDSSINTHLRHANAIIVVFYLGDKINAEKSLREIDHLSILGMCAQARLYLVGLKHKDISCESFAQTFSPVLGDRNFCQSYIEVDSDEKLKDMIPFIVQQLLMQNGTL